MTEKESLNPGEVLLISAMVVGGVAVAAGAVAVAGVAVAGSIYIKYRVGSAVFKRFF
jgi:hypothetical protein